jgi:hypothetical protein
VGQAFEQHGRTRAMIVGECNLPSAKALDDGIGRAARDVQSGVGIGFERQPGAVDLIVLRAEMA